MFTMDRAAAPGEMTARGLIVFKLTATSAMPPPQTAGARDVPGGNGGPPRSFGDYAVKVNEADLPAGITIEAKSKGRGRWCRMPI